MARLGFLQQVLLRTLVTEELLRDAKWEAHIISKALDSLRESQEEEWSMSVLSYDDCCGFQTPALIDIGYTYRSPKGRVYTRTVSVDFPYEGNMFLLLEQLDPGL
jgi:hypothetical protein